MAAIAVANIAAWRFYLYVLSENWRLARLGYSQVHLPDAIGSNAVNFFALVTACVCVLAAMLCARWRSAALLRQELLRSTLDSLQLLPIREERWLWLLSAHPFLLSLLVGACGLPIYMLAIWTSDWRPTDLIGLFFVFAWVGHVAPLWQPTAWKQGGARAQPKLSWKTLRAQMSSEAVELPRSLADNAATSSYQAQANRLELQRRQQRLLLGATTPATSPATSLEAAPGAISSTGNDATTSSDAKKKTNASRRAQNNWIGSAFALYQVFRLVFLVARWSPASGPAHLLSSLWRDTFAALPESVTALWPSFLVTWPLLLARTFLAPLPFFRVALPPLWIFAVLWIGFFSLRNTVLASLVSSSETFWTTRRVRKQNKTSRAVWLCFGVAFLGYAWPTFIARGELSSILGDFLPSTPRALAALWTLLVIGATIAAARQAEAVLSRAALFAQSSVEENAVWQARVWRQAAFRVLDVFAPPLIAYFVFCLLGGVAGWNASWLARLAPTLFTSLAFLVAVFGCATLQNALPPQARAPWKTVRFLWFWGLPLEIVARYFWGLWRGVPFDLNQAPHVVFSPVVSLLGLLRGNVSALGGVAWTTIASAQTLVGLLCLACAWAIVFRHAPPMEARFNNSEVPFGARVINVLLAPFRLAARVLTAIYDFFKRIFAWMGRKTDGVNERILRRGARFDNAVLTSELRRRLRKSNWFRQWLWVSATFLALFGLFFVLPLCLEVAYRSQFIGWPQAWDKVNWADYGKGLLTTTGIAAVLMAALCVLNAGQSFDGDRANGTLVFLFLTPMSDRAIVWGKSVAELIYAAILLTTTLPYLLLGIALMFVGDDLSALSLTLIGVPFVLSLGVFSTFLNILFAVRARKPTEGSGKSLLVLLLYVGAIIVALGAFDSLQTLTSFNYFVIAAGLTLAQFALAFACHKLALWSLRRVRYGDIKVDGKIAA